MIEAVHDFMLQTFVQSIIVNLVILCLVIASGAILTLFVYDLISLLHEALRRIK